LQIEAAAEMSCGAADNGGVGVPGGGGMKPAGAEAPDCTVR
jgi:hypothetical protein